MSNRRFAIWAMTRLVLSPSVAATNASAFSIPAASAHPRGHLGGNDDRLAPTPARLLHDPLSVGARAHRRSRDLDALVLLADLLGSLQRPARLADPVLGDARVERQRHRDLNDV